MPAEEGRLFCPFFQWMPCGQGPPPEDLWATPEGTPAGAQMGRAWRPSACARPGTGGSAPRAWRLQRERGWGTSAIPGLGAVGLPPSCCLV